MKKMIIAVMGVVCGAAIMMGVTVNHYQTTTIVDMFGSH